jgi:hypothetical protein
MSIINSIENDLEEEAHISFESLVISMRNSSEHPLEEDAHIP